jgi:hypothetical protein
VDHEAVLAQARADGFELIEKPLNGQWVIGWARGDDTRWPCYLDERQAIGWMRDRLRRAAVFA